ncbi:MAG: putative transcriptional regulator [Candidatus Poriferisodalaceae bacterium]|jgi:predicted transcriptional regulator
MAPTKTTTKTTTTLRVPSELRDEIARIAEHRGTTMLEVVADAVHRLGRDDWWSSVRDALDGLTSSEAAEYQVESQRMDAALVDGLDER